MPRKQAKKQRKNQLIFSTGTPVEVGPVDEGFSGSWFEATVISHKDLYYNVEYKTLLNEDEDTYLKELVKADNIRPIPPLQNTKQEYKINDIVDAFHLDGWWTGVITKLITRNNNNNINININNNNNVDDCNGNKLYEVMFNYPPEVINFSGSKLRVHLDWIQGKWVQPTRLSKNRTFGKCKAETKESMIRKGKSLKIWSKSSASPAEGADIAEPQERDLTINLIAYQSKSGEKSLKTYKRRKSEKLGENCLTGKKLSSIVKTPPSGKDKTLASSDQTGMHSSKRQRTQNADLSSGNVSNEVAMRQKKKGFKVYCRTKVGIAAGILLKSTVQDLPDGISANGSGSVEQALVSPTVAEGNRGESIDPNSVLETMNKAASVEMEVRVSAVEGNVHLIDSYDQSLPFLKTRFNVWKDIESMETFQAIPQKPHFQLLVNECPEAREGKAIGYMITYSSIVKKVTELWLDDPRGSIEDCLKKLGKLEKNGFDVKGIRDCLNSLLLKKDEYDHLLVQLKELKNQIIEHNCENVKILEEIGKLDKEIKKLEEKRDLAFSKRADMEKKITCLELKLKSALAEMDKFSALKEAAAFP